MADEIYRIIKQDNFVVLDRRFLHNPELSWKAKGILAYILTLPNDWKFHIEELASHSTDGEKGLRAGWNELKNLGYINRIPTREGQRIVSWETQIFEHPSLNPLYTENEEVEDSLLADSVHVHFVDVASVHVQNRRLLSIDKELKIDSTKSTTTTDESESTVMSVYTKVFGSIFMTGLHTEFVQQLKERGCTENMICETLLEVGECGDKPSLRFWKSIVERWIAEGIQSRQESKQQKGAANHGRSQRTTQRNSGSSTTAASRAEERFVGSPNGKQELDQQFAASLKNFE